MFRSLDANGDGKLTLDEAGAGSRPMLQRLFEMSGKPNTGSISREDFNQLVERHRRGEGAAGGENSGNRSPQNRPNPGNPPNPNNPGNSGPHAGPPANAEGLRFRREDLRRLLDQFDQVDANRDGVIDAAEIRTALSRGGTPQNSGTERPPTGNSGNNRSDRPTAPNSRTENTGGTTGNRGTGLAGTWRGWVVDGRGENPNTGHLEMELRIEGNQMTARELGTNRAPGGGAGAEGLGAGTFTFTGEGKSGNLDAVGTSGQQKDREFQGIYELDGNTLKWCVGNNGRPRPREMATGRGNYMMILHRQ